MPERNLKTMAEQAVHLHREGRLEEAETLYRQILDADPALFGPRYYLGLMRLKQGNSAEACTYLGEAVKILPGDPGAQMNYGMALSSAGRHQEALAAFERVLVLQPNLAEALYNRAVAQASLKHFEMAVESYERALILEPEMVAAQVNRAMALAALNRFDDALAGYDRALAMQPSNVAALNHRGLTYRSLGRPREALADYDRALALAPTYADALYNRGVALLDLERAADALAMFDAVLAFRQDDAELLNNRGLALWNLKRLAEALAAYEKALQLEPDFATAWGNRGLCLRDMGRLGEALASFETVLRLEPWNSVALNGMGNVLRDLKRYEQAIEAYGRAIALRPGYGEALINRGYTLWALKQYAAGLSDVERGITLEPNYPYASGEILHARMLAADWRDFAAQAAELTQRVRSGVRAVQPFVFQAITSTPADAQKCSRIWAGDKYPQIPGLDHDPKTRRPADKIRIGYLSGEFRQQATAILMAGVYEHHDRERFEIIALDCGSDDQSPLRARLKATFDRWITLEGLSDDEAAQAIAAAGIAILVNLNGYFGQTRMGICARRPAPVQVNYLGFPATLGAGYIDYIVADRIVIPPSEQAFYDEKVVYLPDCYQANDDKGRPAARRPSRQEAGLPAGGFVFCNFNSGYKLTPETFALWMRILVRTPASVLWLLESPPPYADNLRRQAAACGVAPERLVFAPEIATEAHLARLPLADLFLDGLPYNAHTTGSDALWAGVPLITLQGDTFPGRVGASMLSAMGLADLITRKAKDFEDLAVALAGDPARLADLRTRLAANKQACALFDTAGFTRHLEDAYGQMWQAWLAGLAPQGFGVPSAAQSSRPSVR